MDDSGIITMEEYGNVRLKLKERMDSDGINRNTLARKIGVRFEVVDKLDRDILARICCVLNCTVGDLLEHRRGPGRRAQQCRLGRHHRNGIIRSRRSAYRKCQGEDNPKRRGKAPPFWSLGGAGSEIETPPAVLLGDSKGEVLF